MNDNMKDFIRTLGEGSSVGISFVMAIFIGVVMGRQLDKWLGTSPWFFFIFLFLGVAAGFRNLIYYSKKMSKNKNGKNE
jgi:F0F1-type ATP synthase assembly protein I